jgi:hypothetical protein
MASLAPAQQHECMGRGRVRRRQGGRLIRPKRGEALCTQLGIAHGVLNILMPQVVLNRPSIVAVIGQLKARGVAEHVGMHWEPQLCCRTGACHHLAKRRVRERAFALRDQDRGRVRILPSHLAECAEFDPL